MAKPKNLEQLRAEKERAETQLAQEKHKLNRLENRKKYLEKGERQKRTHRLCNLGGTIESLAPEVKDLTRTEMTELCQSSGCPQRQKSSPFSSCASLKSGWAAVSYPAPLPGGCTGFLAWSAQCCFCWCW